jgi:putative acetyltransferase
MITILRDNSSNKDFRNLTALLDQDLDGRYGADQKQYDKLNIIESIDTVVLAYYCGTAAGCGCFKVYDRKTIEIKRVYVKPEFRGKGISKLIIRELENWGRHIGYSFAILETGNKQIEAIGLYEASGYYRTENFGQYIGIPSSVCMKKTLN